MNDIVAQLKARSVLFQVTHENLDDIVRDERPPVYCGFDPTGTSLHIGSLLPILGLVRFQQAGFKPIILVGGATGMIGDPSGKDSERKLLGPEEIEANARGIEAQLRRFLDFDRGACSAQVVNNAEWFSRYCIVDFLRDIGKHFSLAPMLAKEAVKSRMEVGISYTEFSYILLQAYDFLHLFDTFGCRIQVGGQDQWGNITAGIDLIRRLRGKEAFGVTLPLLTTSSGKKFGKSEAGTVWLDGELTSPYQFYQYLINTSDEDVISYLKFFTLLSLEEIEEYAQGVRAHPEKREAQQRLAWEVTRLVHGEDQAQVARNASAVLFGGEIKGCSDRMLEEIFADVPRADFSLGALSAGIDLVEALVACRAVASKGEARRLLNQNGVSLNNEKVNEAHRILGMSDLASEHFLVLRIGKKKYFLLRFV